MLGKTVLGQGNFGEVREGVVWHKDKIVKVAIKSLKGKSTLGTFDTFFFQFDKSISLIFKQEQSCTTFFFSLVLRGHNWMLLALRP